MKADHRGMVFEGDPQGAHPGLDFTSFTDADGIRVVMSTDLILRLAALIEFDAKVRGYEETLNARIQEKIDQVKGKVKK